MGRGAIKGSGKFEVGWNRLLEPGKMKRMNKKTAKSPGVCC
jgi:hypothetical protein